MTFSGSCIGIRLGRRHDEARVAATGERLFGAGRSRLARMPELTSALGLREAVAIGQHRAGEVYLGDCPAIGSGGSGRSEGESIVAMAMAPTSDPRPELIVIGRIAGLIPTLATRGVSIGRADLDEVLLPRRRS